jgi:23S rRNA (uracil1939-C5)-methyltransferase
VSRSKSVPQPPEVAQIAALNHDGAGVVKEGKTAFVPGALPGETVRYSRVMRHRQYDEARLLEVLQPSPDRVVPRCAHFGVCGGCALQHMSPAAQVAAKRVELADALARIGRVEPETWLEPLEGPVWGYRRRARLGAKYVPKRGRALVGFRERAKPYVAALERCEILASPVDALIAPLSELLTGLAGREAIPQIEVAVAEGATALVLRVLEDLGRDDMAALAAFEQRHGVHFYLQRGGLETVQPLTPPAPRLQYSLPDFDLQLEFTPVDFIQVNAAVNRALVTRAVDLLGAGPGDRVLDLFCGLGNFTLALARRAGHVTGVEGDAGLVARARRNAQLNGIDNAAFHAVNLAAADALDAPAFAGPWTHVLIDPPRAGAIELLPHLARLAPRRIVYISCHPGSLARDVGELCANAGMALRAAGVLDMFPHTNHVESIAVLEPRGR